MPNARIGPDGAFECEVGNLELSMKRGSGDDWRLESPEFSGALHLDLDEAQSLMYLGQHHAPGAKIALAGVDWPTPIEEGVDLRPIRAQVASEENAIYLDTTTIAAVERLTSPSSPVFSTAGLLDMSVVTFAFTFFDTIVTQGEIDDASRWVGGVNSNEVCQSKMGDAFRRIGVDRQTITSVLWPICAEIFTSLNGDDARRREYDQAWNEFLGRDDIRLSGMSVDLLQNSPAYWDGVPASGYIENPSALDATSLSQFLSVQTVRTVFGDSLASALRVPYVASTIRSPIYVMLLRQRMITQLFADKLFEPLARQSEAKPARHPAYAIEYSAPLAAAALIERMDKPDDFWPRLIEIRAEYEPLRRRLWEDREEWTGRSGQYVDKYVRHMNGLLPDHLRLVNDALPLVAGVAARTAGAPAGGIGIAKLAAQLALKLRPVEHLYDWYLEKWRPDVAVVSSFAKEAEKFRTIENRISKVWGHELTRSALDDLENFSRHRPETFAKLIDLG